MKFYHQRHFYHLLLTYKGIVTASYILLLEIHLDTLEKKGYHQGTNDVIGGITSAPRTYTHSK
jgi:hypothetical protein